MGNVLSIVPTGGRDNVTRESEENMSTSEDSEEFHDTIDELEYGDGEGRSQAKEAEMEEFRRQLEIKREQRRVILDRHKTEKKELEIALENEAKAKLEAYESNRKLRELLLKNNIEIPDDLQSSTENSNITETIVNMKEQFEKLKMLNNKLRKDLADANISLQGAYSDIADLHEQNTGWIKQIKSLKEVISMSKNLLNLREEQLNELKSKLSEIEQSLADRESNMLSTDLREEYQRQLANIRTLRALYEERARLSEVTRQGLLREVEEQKTLKLVEISKVNDLTAKVKELETKLEELEDIISNKNNQIYTTQGETRGLKEEMSAVNKLFSQVLLGYKNPQDLDKLIHRLEENHGLLTHMAEKEIDFEASTALPKLLLEIVSQVDEEEMKQSGKESISEGISIDDLNVNNLDAQNSNNATAKEIVQNLPKVWRVLMELLSHQTTPEDNASEKVTTCYKTVETKSGPVQVPSVSQTYIRLKDLILEKLALNKEVNRMKQLNGHLESRLEEQERRLCLVTTELSKTWHVVGRLRRHHHQLHTHEKILKYELQQKRKLLNELKEELEYCREKWEQAREKNSQTERDWRKLRTEFSSRKNKSNVSINTSAESGYSDERPSDESSESNDESEYLAESLGRSKKKIKSFETILDSSADFNLAAEREDPASDLLDVADLPLDDHHEKSDSCNSESLLKSEKVYEETEDEVGDITHDSLAEDTATDHSQSNNNLRQNKPSVSKLPQPNVPLIDPAAIMNSIREQNERLAKKDKKLESLEKTGAALLLQTQTTSKLSDQINSTLDHLLNRPTSSGLNSQIIQDNQVIMGSTTNTSPNELLNDKSLSVKEIKIPITDYVDGNKPSTTNQNSQESIIQIEQILENVKHQNEQLAKKDESLVKFENECAKIANNMSNTVLQYSTSVGDGTDVDNDYQLNQKKTSVATDEDNSDVPSTSKIDLKVILENKLNCQNESLAKKDERLQKLEIVYAEVVNNMTNTLEKGQDISEKLDSLHLNSETVDDDERKDTKTVDVNNESSSSRGSSEPSTSSEMDHEARFAARDIRLKRLEEQTKSLVNKVNKTTTKGVKIHYKLEELHNIYGSENSRAGTPSDNEDKSTDEISSDEKNNEDKSSEENSNNETENENDQDE